MSPTRITRSEPRAPVAPSALAGAAAIAMMVAAVSAAQATAVWVGYGIGRSDGLWAADPSWFTLFRLSVLAHLMVSLALAVWRR